MLPHAVKLPSGANATATVFENIGELLFAHDCEIFPDSCQFDFKFRENKNELLHYGRRYYNPALGRWLGRDPIEEKGGLHLYGFVGNNGVNRFDVLGMFDWYYTNPDGSIGHYFPEITDSPGDFLTMDRDRIIMSANRSAESMSGWQALAGAEQRAADIAANQLANDIASINAALAPGVAAASANLSAGVDASISGISASAGASVVASGNSILTTMSGSMHAGVVTASNTMTNQISSGMVFGSTSAGAFASAGTSSPSGYSPSDIAAASARNTQQLAANPSTGTHPFQAIIAAGRETFGNAVFQQPLATLATAGAQATALVGATYATVAAAPILSKDIHVEGPQRGTRIAQVRYGNTPLIRLDYGRYPGSGGEPRLHLNIGPGKDNLHISIDPRTWRDRRR